MNAFATQFQDLPMPLPVTASNTPQWHALYVLPRHEKTVARHFTERGISHFLLLYQCTRRWNKRTARISLPLFPGYIFVQDAPSERGRVLQVPGVVYYVGVGAVPTPILDSEIQNLRTILLSGKEILPHPYLAPSSPVRIAHGPLSGLVGMVERTKSGNRFVVSIDLIQRSVSVELDGASLLPMAERPSFPVSVASA